MAGTEQESEDLALMITAAKQAGEIGMRYFRSNLNDVWYKNGHSPVSTADLEIDRFLKTMFSTHRPDYGWLSEETADDHARVEKERVVIVDPIDGTRGFIKGCEEWCISIAIANGSRPETSVLYCPALQQLFAAERGSGVRTENVPLRREATGNRPLVTGSSKLIGQITDDRHSPFEASGFIPSLAYRLALVAAGQLDGAFARAGAKEWDVAAADLILEESNCVLRDRHGAGLTYNNRSVSVPELIATNERDFVSIKNLANECGFLQ